MNDPIDQPTPHRPAPKIDPETSPGAYATGLVVIHTRDEFMLDFISGFAPPPRIVGRVIVTPPSIKRMLRALMENIGLYEKAFGAIATPVENTRAQPGQVADLYSKLQMTDGMLGGVYSNGLAVMHTRDEFIIDFATNFPPAAKVAARIIVSPGHLRRIISVLGDNLNQYENRFGAIADGAPPAEQCLRFNLN
jgi:hypothetical protein